MGRIAMHALDAIARGIGWGIVIVWGVIFPVVFLVLLLTSLWPNRAGAQEQPGHALFHEYYRFWHNQNGTHCCDERHCRPIQPGEIQWNRAREGWDVLVHGTWIFMEASRYVIDDGGLGPFGSVCHQGGHVFCFDPPEASF